MSQNRPHPFEHPDELELVAWSEHRLLGFESEAIELHLADCGECRELAAQLAQDELIELEPRGLPQEPAAQPAIRRTGLPVILPLVLAVAAVLIAMVVIPWGGDRELQGSGFELALAGSREATFGSQRSAPLETGELFVGLRLEQASAWLRLIAIDNHGAAFEVPLDPEGRTTASFVGASDHVFGPYPTDLGEGRVVAAMIALASPVELLWSELQLVDWSAALEESSVPAAARELGAVAHSRQL